MNYCSECGGAVQHRVPEGDNLPRYVCDACGRVHYQNPLVVVGCLPVKEDCVLLCRRAIEPRSGYWTLPAGFLENDETTWEGALRETWEEARAKVGKGELYRLYDLAYIRQVYIFYRAALLNDDFGAGTESTEVDLFTEESIPWDDIAFPVVTKTLRDFFQDRRDGGEYTVRHGQVERLSHRLGEGGG